LWLIDDNESATKNLVEQAISQGVGSNRLVFASKLALAEHLERISHADLFLDTFPCNAHTTASDSLWAGVPVVTIKGRSFASRVAASLLTYTGLSELVTNNQNEYVEKIRELAFNKMKLQNLKFELLNRKANAELVLFDSKRFVKDYEILLKSIVK
jgi:predicted O-linked N-acetylglucosamine transferase (SPINDLY family)